jgi:hypothetical protein
MAVEDERLAVRGIAAVVAPVDRQWLLLPAGDRT